MKHLNENAKIILCLDISCELLNLPFADTKLAIQQACLNKSSYNKNRKTIQKVLDLNKKLTIDEVIRKLGITHSSAVEKKAKEIFRVYMNLQSFHNHDIDSSVFVMSVYYACKFENVKIAKKNVLNLSSLTHGQWVTLEKSWEKWVNDLNTNKKDVKKDAGGGKENIVNNQMKVDSQKGTKRVEEAEETYDEWAKRILDAAYAKLRTIK